MATPAVAIDLKAVSAELNRVISAYASDFVGRERTLRLIMLALISKHHIYLLSPPGTGKTMMEAVARSFGMSTFYYLYSYDTKLEHILYNPVILKEQVPGGEKIVIDFELKNPGLGTAEIHYADEMFRAPSAVLNALLGAMNERRVTLGSRDFKIPLWTLIAASNKLPEDSADALLDRFLYRDFLKYLPKEMWYEYLVRYWNMHQPGYSRVKVNVDRKVLEAASAAVPAVDIYGVIDDLAKLFDRIQERNIVLSDRRKGRILLAVAASAVLDGRDYADPSDLEVLIYTAPTNEDQLNVVLKEVDAYLGGVLKVKEELESLERQVRAFTDNISMKGDREIADFLNWLPRVRSKAVAVNLPSLQRRAERLLTTVNEAEERATEVLARRALGL